MGRLLEDTMALVEDGGSIITAANGSCFWKGTAVNDETLKQIAVLLKIPPDTLKKVDELGGTTSIYVFRRPPSRG